MTDTFTLSDEVMCRLREAWPTGVAHAHLKQHEPATVAHILSEFYATQAMRQVKESMLVIGFGKGDTDNRYEKTVGNFFAIWPGFVLFRHEYFKTRGVCSGMLVRDSKETQGFAVIPFGDPTTSKVSIGNPTVLRNERFSAYGQQCKAVLSWSNGPYNQGSIGIAQGRWATQKAWLEKWLPLPG